MAMADISTEAGPVPAENQRVYEGFLRITKWSVIVIAIVLLLMGIALT